MCGSSLESIHNMFNHHDHTCFLVSSFNACYCTVHTYVCISHLHWSVLLPFTYSPWFSPDIPHPDSRNILSHLCLRVKYRPPSWQPSAAMATTTECAARRHFALAQLSVMCEMCSLAGGQIISIGWLVTSYLKFD